MGPESLSEIARQINPRLWDKPGQPGSDPIQTQTLYRNFVIEDDTKPIVHLTGVRITKVASGKTYIYESKPENTPYEKGAVYKVRGVTFNEDRHTMTIIYEDVDEQIQFATWRLNPSINKIDVIFKPVWRINSVDHKPY